MLTKIEGRSLRLETDDLDANEHLCRLDQSSRSTKGAPLWIASIKVTSLASSLARDRRVQWMRRFAAIYFVGFSRC
jgi:hypothetical protein